MFKGKTIKAPLEKRAGNDPAIQKDVFLQGYGDFYLAYNDMDDATKTKFRTKGNAVLDDFEAGDSLTDGEEGCKEFFDDLGTPDLV